MMKRILILGANSQIAKSLIPLFKKNFLLDLYSRKKINLKDKNINTYKLNEFPQNKNIIAVINCAGPGDPKIHRNKKNIFKIFDTIDNNILKYIQDNQKIKYINISTGIVLNIKKTNNMLTKTNFDYVNTKLYLERKHRLLKNLKIYDLRVFGFFSRYINLNAGFFLSQVLKSIKKNKTLLVDSVNNSRDYIGGYDLYKFIKKLINKNFSNGAFNLLSKKKTNKFDILKFYKKKYKLHFIIQNEKNSSKANNKSLVNLNIKKNIHFKPKYDSLKLIKEETKHIYNF